MSTEVKTTVDCVWREFTNKNGKKYQIGYPKSAGFTEENIDAKLAERKAEEEELDRGTKWVSVNWVPKINNVWRDTCKDVANKGISKYKLDAIPDATLYMYELKFINTGGWYFDFMDESGDEYTVYTVDNEEHYLNYNSTAPTIVKVN